MVSTDSEVLEDFRADDGQISCYSYHTLEDGEQPNKGIQLMWCILLILLPIALLFAESSMNNLQSVSIVAAFPIGAVIVMIAISFMKDAKKYMENLEKSVKEKSENLTREIYRL